MAAARWRFTGRTGRPTPLRRYAFDLRDFFRFLAGRGTQWQKVTAEDVALFAGWLRLLPDADSGTVTVPPATSDSRRPNLARERGNVAGQIGFTEIPQPWLRELAKRYVRMRLSAGLSVTMVQRHHGSIVSLAELMERVEPSIRSAAALDRELL